MNAWDIAMLVWCAFVAGALVGVYVMGFRPSFADFTRGLLGRFAQGLRAGARSVADPVANRALPMPKDDPGPCRICGRPVPVNLFATFENELCDRCDLAGRFLRFERLREAAGFPVDGCLVDDLIREFAEGEDAGAFSAASVLQRNLESSRDEKTREVNPLPCVPYPKGEDAATPASSPCDRDPEYPKSLRWPPVGNRPKVK